MGQSSGCIVRRSGSGRWRVVAVLVPIRRFDNPDQSREPSGGADNALGDSGEPRVLDRFLRNAGRQRGAVDVGQYRDKRDYSTAALDHNQCRL